MWVVALVILFVSGMCILSCNKERPSVEDEMENNDNNDNGNNADNNDNGDDQDDGQTTETTFDFMLDDASNLAYNQAIDHQSSGTDAGKVMDGDPNTYWEPTADDRGDQEVSLNMDLGEIKTVNEVVLYWVLGNKQVSGYSIAVSKNNTNWYDAYAYPFESVADSASKAVFNSQQARYVRVTLRLNAPEADIKLGEIAVYNDDAAEAPTNIALGMAVAAQSSECSGTCDGYAKYIVDGDQSTFWQPLSGDRKDDNTVSITIDLGTSKAFNGLAIYWQQGSKYIGNQEITYSDDNESWENAFQTSTALGDEGTSWYGFPVVQGRYIKIILHLADEGAGTEKIREIELFNTTQR